MLGHLWFWVFFLKVVVDILAGILVWPFLAPFGGFAEVPQVTCKDTEVNTLFLSTASSALAAYRPAAWLSGPWAQLFFFESLGQPRTLKFTRKIYTFSDGVPAAVDYKSSSYYVAEDAPLAVICHGLAGDSENAIIVRLSEELASRGWRVAVYIRRGHGDLSLLPHRSDNTTAAQPQQASVVNVFPRHCDLDDMEQVSQAIAADFPKAPKALIGFSAGANIVTKYLGEAGKHNRSIPYAAGVSVSNGHNVNDVTSELSERRWTADKILLFYLKQLFVRRLDDVKALAAQQGVQVDWDAVLSASSVRMFESLFMLPLYSSYKSIDDFYLDNSSHESIEHTRVPLLCLANRDDPIIKSTLPDHAVHSSRVNSNVVTVVTHRGGHLGWLEGYGKTWASRVILPFLDVAMGL
jgi:predicted alpha/beta-fold hydrolase